MYISFVEVEGPLLVWFTWTGLQNTTPDAASRIAKRTDFMSRSAAVAIHMSFGSLSGSGEAIFILGWPLIG